MNTYVLMSRLQSGGPSMIEVASAARKGSGVRRNWLNRVKEQLPEVKFLAHFALLGSWDFMDIYEAPNAEAAAQVSLMASASGRWHVESWTAISEERLVELADRINQDTGLSGEA